MTYLQRKEQLQETVSLPETHKRIGGKYLNTFKAFLLVKRRCNGLNEKTYELYSKPYSNLEIVEAIKKVFPELYDSHWSSR